MTIHDETMAVLLLERPARRHEELAHCRWSSQSDDFVHLGWGEDFVLVPRWVRDHPSMPLEEKRQFVYEPIAHLAPKPVLAPWVVP